MGKRALYPMPEPIVGRDGWTEHYGTYHFTLTKGLVLNCSLSVDRANPGYRVSFNSRFLVINVLDVDDAKAAAWRLARKVLFEAVSKLEEVQGKPLKA